MTILVDSPVYCVAFYGDGSYIISGSYDNSVHMWDAWSGVELKVFNGHTGSVQSVAFSSDGTYIVSGSDDGSVRVWDALSGVELQVLNGHTDHVQSVAFSGDGTHIVSGSWDKSVWVWDALSGETLNVFNGHTDCVWSVAFSSDGTHIVSGSSDRSVQVWDLVNYNDLLWTYDGERSYIMSSSGEDLLMWLPHAILPVLYHPYNSLIIFFQGSAKVDFQNCKIGPDWQNCYTPLIWFHTFFYWTPMYNAQW